MVAIVFTWRGASQSYLRYSIGLIVATMVSGAFVGWVQHALVRAGPPRSGPRVVTRLLVYPGLASALVSIFMGLAVYAAIDVPLEPFTAAIALGLASTQQSIGNIVVGSSQYQLAHGQLLVFECLRSAGGLFGGLLGLLLRLDGVEVLATFSAGALLAAIVPALRVRRQLELIGLSGERLALKPYVRWATRYGSPIVVAILALAVIQFSDRLVLSFYEGAVVAGVYASAYDLLTKPIAMLATAVSAAGQRATFKAHDESGDMSALIGRDLRFQAVAVTLGGFGFLMCALVAPTIFNRLVDVPLIVQLSAFASAGLFGFVQTLMRPLQAKGRTAQIGTVALASAVINIVLNLMTVPLFGVVGAAVSTVVSVGFIVSVFVWIAPEGRLRNAP